MGVFFLDKTMEQELPFPCLALEPKIEYHYLWVKTGTLFEGQEGYAPDIGLQGYLFACETPEEAEEFSQYVQSPYWQPDKKPAQKHHVSSLFVEAASHGYKGIQVMRKVYDPDDFSTWEPEFVLHIGSFAPVKIPL